MQRSCRRRRPAGQEPSADLRNESAADKPARTTAQAPGSHRWWDVNRPPRPGATNEELKRWALEIGGIPEYDSNAFQDLLLCSEDWPPMPSMLMYVRHGHIGLPLELIAYSAGTA